MITRVLVVGATGSIGRHVVAELLERGVHVRALTRSPASAQLPDAVETFRGDVATAEGLGVAMEGVDAVVLTHGGDDRSVDYDGVRNVLNAIGGRDVRLVLMTSMGVTRETTAWDGIMNWKRRAERLVRAYGAPYTIVRPGWFDYQAATQNAVVLEQGDRTEVTTRRGVARTQIARVLVEALFSDSALGKTFELFAEEGDLQEDLEPLFAALVADDPVELAGGGDHGVGLAEEPREVGADIDAIRARRA